MGEKVYLIYRELRYEYIGTLGVIIGTEEKAKEWCKTYNAKCKSHYDTVSYEETKILTEDDLRDT